MAPRTRMTPEQVATAVKLRRKAWEEKTGVKLQPDPRRYDRSKYMPGCGRR